MANDQLLTQASELLIYNVFAFLAGLLFMVALHEYGHYIVARWCGVRVDKFSVGFGRELIGFNDKKGTRWCLSLWPLGGYVKIFGDYDVENPKMWDPSINAVRPLTKEELAVAFCSKSVWQRMAIVLAGPLINFIPAFFILVIIFTFWGQGSNPPIINGIDVNGTGYKAGFRLNDEILEFNGMPVRRFEDVHDVTMKNFSQTFHFKVKRDDKILEFNLQPSEEKYVDLKGIERANGRIGMAFFNGFLLKEIVSVEGIDTKDKPDLARSLLAERFDKIIRFGIEYRNDKISIYEGRFPSRFNAHLNNPDDRFYDRVLMVDKDARYYVRLSFWEGLTRTADAIFKLPLEVYKRIKAVVVGTSDEQIVAGVGKMSSMFADAAKNGTYSYLILLCIFSIQLAFINILPIPVLDGGYLVFLSIEALRGRPLSQKVQNYAYLIGIVMLLGIMIIANVSDIIHFLR